MAIGLNGLAKGAQRVLYGGQSQVHLEDLAEVCDEQAIFWELQGRGSALSGTGPERPEVAGGK